MVLILFGAGVVANVLLTRTNADGDTASWVLITFGWGFAVFAGASIADASGGAINPAVTLGSAISGGTPWSQVPWYLIGQFLGAFVGAVARLARLQAAVRRQRGQLRHPEHLLDQPADQEAGVEHGHRDHRDVRAGPLPAGRALRRQPRDLRRAPPRSSSVSASRSAGRPATRSTRPVTSGRASPTRSCRSAARASPTGATPGCPVVGPLIGADARRPRRHRSRPSRPRADRPPRPRGGTCLPSSRLARELLA